MSLAQSTLKGVMWAYASFFSGKLLTMLSTAILARLLFPADFGLIGFALILLNFVDATRNFGVMEALIYNDDRVNDASDTAFIINLGIGLLQFAITFLLAPLAVHFINDPRIVDVVRVMSIAFIFNGFGDTHDALLQKELKFNRRFAPDLLSALIKGVVSIVAALAGLGIWSLVVGYIIGSAVRTVTSWIVMPWRPRLKFYKDKARDLWHYGMHILMLNGLSILLDQVDPMVVGMLLGTIQLGYYSIATKIPELIVINISLVLTKVIFPTYVKIKDDRELLIRGYFKTTQFTVFITAAAGVGMAAVAPEMVAVIFGKQWMPAVPLVQVLAILGTMSTLAWNAGDVFKAIGRPDISFKLLLLESTYTFALVYGFAAASHLALMTAVGNLIAVVIGALIRLWLMARFLKFNPFSFITLFRASFVGSVAMFLVVTAWRELVVGTLSNTLVLITSVIIGGIIYVSILWVMEQKQVRSASSIFLGTVRRTSSAQPADLQVAPVVVTSANPEA